MTGIAALALTLIVAGVFVAGMGIVLRPAQPAGRSRRRATSPRSRPLTTWRARFGLIIHHAREQWRRLAGIVALTVLQSIMAVAQPWPLKVLADYALGGAPVPSSLSGALGTFGLDPDPRTLVITAAVLILAISIVSQAMANLLTWLWESAGQRMVYSLSNRMYRHLQWLSLSFHTKQPIGDTLTRLNSDSWSIYYATDALLIAPFANGLTLVSVAISAWLLDPTLALVAFVTAPVTAITAAVLGGRIKRTSNEVRVSRGRMTSFVQQTVATLPLIHAYGTQKRTAEEFGKQTDTVTNASIQQALADRLFVIATGLTAAVGTAVITFFGAWMVIEGDIPVGTLLVFLAYLRTLELRSRAVLDLYRGFRAAEVGLDRILEVVGQESDVRDPVNPRELPPRKPGAGRTVRFENVHFEYERGTPILTAVNLEARPGDTIALVGRSGAGKSTLVSLIVRAYDPQMGHVLIDGIDARHLRLTDLRRDVGIVSQDPLLLPISVALNIAYGRPDATIEDIKAAAEAANADEFIRRLPDGYETVLSERGAALSGGQRQRLAIARAILKDAPIVILDEPTSALDTSTEHLVMEALSRLQEHRTTFIIAHRLSTIASASRVVLLEGGRAIEQVPGEGNATPTIELGSPAETANNEGTGS